MIRIMYEPTEKQAAKWTEADSKSVEMPSDEVFKARWMKAHHGKMAGWGLEKRQWIIQNLASGSDYQMGLWQGRVDKARGMEYQEVTEDKSFNLGYYRGYVEFESNYHGWDAVTRQKFDEKYRKENRNEKQ